MDRNISEYRKILSFLVVSVVLPLCIMWSNRSIQPFYIWDSPVNKVTIHIDGRFEAVDDPAVLRQLMASIGGTWLLPELEQKGVSKDIYFVNLSYQDGSSLCLDYDKTNRSFVNTGEPRDPSVYDAIDTLIDAYLPERNAL